MQTKQAGFLKDSNSYAATTATVGVLVWLMLNLLPVRQAGALTVPFPLRDHTVYTPYPHAG